MDLAKQQTIVAERNLDTAEIRVRESVAQTAAAVKQAYWTLKATRANIAVQQRSLELAQELAQGLAGSPDIDHHSVRAERGPAKLDVHDVSGTVQTLRGSEQLSAKAVGDHDVVAHRQTEHRFPSICYG